MAWASDPGLAPDGGLAQSLPMTFRACTVFRLLLILPLPALSLAALPLAPSPAVAQQKHSIDALAEHLALPIASGLAGARNAATFGWVVNAAGVRNIWVGGPDTPARQLTRYTQDDGIELSEVMLSPDGRTLAFVRGGDAEFPDSSLPNTDHLAQTPDQQILLATVDGAGEPMVIGAGHGAAFSPDGSQIAFSRKNDLMLWDGKSSRTLAKLAGDVGRLQWSPDGKTLLFREDRGDHSLIGLFDIAAGQLRYPGATLGDVADPIFSPDGRSIAFIQLRDPPASQPDSQASFWSIHIIDRDSGDVRVRWRAPAGAGGRYYGTRGRNLFWTRTGELLFPWERSGWLHIQAMRAEGNDTPRDLTPDANEVENFTPSPDGKSVVYSANAGNLDTRQLWRQSLVGGAAERLTKDDRFTFFPVVGGDRLAATSTDARHPAHMVLVDGMKPLSPVPVASDFTLPQVVTFQAEDGVTVHAQLFPGKGSGKRPALVFVHGGPRRQMLPGFHPSYYYSNAYVRNQLFAARGYTVLSVNYRSGTNYGQAFRQAPEIARQGASEYRDVLAAGRWLAARKDVDPARIGIWGGSWGGYLTALALARDSDLFAAGVDLHGVHNMLRPTGAGLSPEEDRKVRQLQWDSSPLGSIDRWRSPVLIIHGDDDKNVDYGQSLLLARELTARDVPFEEMSVPNERHDFFRYANWLAAYRAAEDFFDRRLTGMPPEALPVRGNR